MHQLVLAMELTKSLYIQDVLILKDILGGAMEVAITKMSSNGQVVIPVEIREEANKNTLDF